MRFQKVLVANRGEIAARVIRTVKQEGYASVAVFTEADRASPHVALADQAICIGEGPVADSYLCPDKLIEACQKTGADAVHPGYGFLSENAEFIRLCEANGICFIGPSADSVDMMGCKRQAKQAVESVGVSCIPGYDGQEQSDACLLEAAQSIGFPLMIKATAGGGGRGLRRVESPETFSIQLASAKSEAFGAFGSDQVMLEKWVEGARHVEAQIISDAFGNHFYLGSRDCSLQRKHQKIIEEAPAFDLPDDIEISLQQMATQVAKACQYQGVGTVEFLYSAEESDLYFLEMNTRLQVEHPVTEMVSGLDLVCLQLQVAQGDPLLLDQQDLLPTGVAVEARLYAEDPDNWMPQTGKLLHFSFPERPHVRVDLGYQQGQSVTPFYDPMLAKVIAFGRTRSAAIQRLQEALGDVRVLGVQTNLPLLSKLLASEAFQTKAFHVQWLDQTQYAFPRLSEEIQVFIAVAVLLSQTDSSGWSSAVSPVIPFVMQVGSADFEIKAQRQLGDAQAYRLTLGDQEISLMFMKGVSGTLKVELSGDSYDVNADQRLNSITFTVDGLAYQVDDFTLRPRTTEQAEIIEGSVLAPMDGQVKAVHVTANMEVKKGDPLLMMEAMKMEQVLKATRSGRISELPVSEGDQVKNRQLLALIDD